MSDVQKADVLDVLKYFKQKADDVYLGGDGGLYPIVKVRSETGNTVTMSKGNTTLTATENNSYWEFTVPDYGVWTITAVDTEQNQRVTTINVDSVKIYNKDARVTHRYGYRISKNEADPYARVEYLYDAEGMRPAYMNYLSGKFDYGDWGDAWFVTGNKPCMLKSNGTVDYYLDRNDYTLRDDGETPSDIANTDYDGNAMAQFPLVWVYRYEDDDYYYEIICDRQLDENYKAYAHTDANGIVKDNFYLGLFGSSGTTEKIRSLSDQTVLKTTPVNIRNAAMANGAGWYPMSWMQHELIRTLLVLMSKSTDSQTMFGNGPCSSSTPLVTGLLKSNGQFKGFNNDYAQQVKVFCVEELWGNSPKPLMGVYLQSNNIYVTPTPQSDDFAYSYTNGTVVGAYLTGETYAKKMYHGEYGMHPKEAGGSSTTYFCDNTQGTSYYIYATNKETASTGGGIFSLYRTNTSDSNCGSLIAYV